MPALVTTKFRVHNAKQFREMFDEAALYGGSSASDDLSTNLYLFIGKSSAWSGSFSDVSVPDPNTDGNPSSDTIANTSYSHWKDMIAAKKIASSDVSHVIPRNNWTSGRYYSMYDHTETFSDLISERASQDVYNGSTATTATLYPIYVMNQNYQVYKCLYNGKTEAGLPVASTVEPTSTDTSAALPAPLADGYVWKYMYTIGAAEALKFITNNYIPVKQIRDANSFGEGGTTGGMTVGGAKDDSSDQVVVERNAIAGALDIFVISNDGGDYHFEDNMSIVSGSGTSLVLSSPSLTVNDAYNNSAVYFTYSGSSYVRKVTDSVYDAGTSRVTLTLDSSLGVTLSGSLTANIAPYLKVQGDGQGEELMLTANTSAANSIGGVTVVSSGNSYTTATLSVEQQGTGAGSGAALTAIIPPQGGHGYNPVDELGGYYIMINTKLTQDESGKFTTTNDFRKIGLLKDPNSDGSFTRYTADTATQAKTLTYSSLSGGTLTGDITITGGDSGATAYVVDVNATASTMRVVDVTNGSSETTGYDGIKGSIQTGEQFSSGAITFNVDAVANGDMSIGSGEILYIENRAPVARAADQTEDVKLIIEF